MSLIAQIETVTGLEASVERTLDLVGVFVFAVSGALLAVRKGYDVVGVVALGLVTALGGGVMHDTILGSTPAMAFSEPWYLVVPLAGAATVFVANTWIVDRLERPVLVFDAAGLGLFCVTGAVKSTTFDTTPAGAVLLGLISAVGGGILRDVLANEHPMIFPRRPRCTRSPRRSDRPSSWSRGATTGTAARSGSPPRSACSCFASSPSTTAGAHLVRSPVAR